MSWNSCLTNWFLNLKREVTCEETIRRKLRLLDLRCHGLENCEQFLHLYPLESIQPLKALLLQSNNLTEFSRSLAHFSENLKYLLLDYNKLKDLPFDMRHMKYLTVLNVSHNGFEDLNFLYVICQLKTLRILWANSTGICELPKEIGELQKLRTLGLRGNMIKFLPAELFTLHNLRWLTLASNEIATVPDEIERLGHLVHLNFNNNRLNELPSTLIYLQELQYLYLKHNFLTITKDVIEFISHIPSMKSCWIKGNFCSSETHGQSGQDPQNVIRVTRLRTSNTRQAANSNTSSFLAESVLSENGGNDADGPLESTLTDMLAGVRGDAGINNSPNTPAVHSTHELETVFQRAEFDESTGASSGIRTQDEDQEITEPGQMESFDADNGNMNGSPNTSCTHEAVRRRSYQVCRIEKWLLDQQSRNDNGSSLPLPTTSISLGSNQAVKRASQRSLKEARQCLGQPIREQVDAFVEEAVEMATTTLQPTQSKGSMYFFHSGSCGDKDPHHDSRATISAVFRCRKSQSTIAISPSLPQLGGQRGNQEARPPQPPAEDEEEFEELDEGEIHSELYSAMESLAPSTQYPRVTPVGSVETEDLEAESNYDPSDWECSCPSSGIDDQEIINRFNEFSDMVDEDDRRELLNDDDLRFLFPLGLIQ